MINSWTHYIIEQVEPIDDRERFACRRGFKVFVVRTKRVKGLPIVFRTLARNTHEVEGEIEYRHQALLGTT